MPTTYIIGTVFVDIKAFSRNPYNPEGRNVGDIRIIHGGVCRNVCEDFAQQGESVSFVSAFDPTALGDDVVNRLRALNVDLTYVRRADRGMGLWMAILNEKGDLAGSISQQPDFSPIQDIICTKGEEIVRKADHIVLEIDTNEIIAGEVLRLARKYRRPVYAIVGNMHVILARPDFLRDVRVFICNEIEAGQLFGATLDHCSPEEMLKALKTFVPSMGIPAIVITMGAHGAVYYDTVTGASGHSPALHAKLVDSTGAGDAFFSGTVMALNHGYSLRDAVGVGNLMASATIARTESACPPIGNLFPPPSPPIR